MMMIFCFEENLIYLTASPILSLSVVFGPDACTHCQWWRLALIEMERMRRMVMVMEIVSSGWRRLALIRMVVMKKMVRTFMMMVNENNEDDDTCQKK